MTQRRPVQDAIQWHEGMLLLPQHFQQMDRRLEHLISYHAQVMLPYAWGVINFEYDTGAALSGKINILNLEAVMPDGSILSSNLSQTNALSLDLKPYIDDLQHTMMTLYAVIVPYHWGKGNASADNPRFSSVEATSVVDENTGDRVVSIPTLSPNFILKLSATDPLGYVSLPLLKIQRLENVYQVSNYFAPQLKVTINSPLNALCRTVTQRIREKIIFLVDRLSSQTSEMVSSDTENIIKSLSTGLLPFEAMIAAGESHPYQVYLQLTQLAAQLIGISPGVTPPLFKAYQHNDVRTSFLEVINFTNSLLDHIQEGYHVVSFILDGRTFNLNLNPEWRAANLVIGAKASNIMSEKDVSSWITQAVMASDNHVAMCREKRILGAPRSFITGIGQEKLMPARDVVLFELKTDERFIDFDQTLQIFNVADTSENRPQELVLYVSKRDDD